MNEEFTVTGPFDPAWDKNMPLKTATREEVWRPISEAPVNQSILIHVANEEYYGNGGIYLAILVDMGAGRRWMTFGCHIGRDLCGISPAAWRPLPPPPKINA